MYWEIMSGLIVACPLFSLVSTSCMSPIYKAPKHNFIFGTLPLLRPPPVRLETSDLDGLRTKH